MPSVRFADAFVSPEQLSWVREFFSWWSSFWFRTLWHVCWGVGDSFWLHHVFDVSFLQINQSNTFNVESWPLGVALDMLPFSVYDLMRKRLSCVVMTVVLFVIWYFGNKWFNFVQYAGVTSQCFRQDLNRHALVICFTFCSLVIWFDEHLLMLQRCTTPRQVDF